MYQRFISFISVFGFGSLILTSCKFRQKADTILYNAKIYTVNTTFDTASAMAIRDGKIISIGSSDEILKTFESDDVINAAGRFVYPGFIDAHAHFYNYGLTLNTVNLVGTDSWEAVVQAVKNFVAEHPVEPGQWITGRGWDQNDWVDKRFPDKSLLDLAFPNNPVLLGRIDGHAAIANQAALDKAGIRAGQQLTGGSIEVLGDQCTGVLIDNAVDLVNAVVPAPAPAQIAKALQKAEQNCFAMGLTTIVDCGLLKPEIDFIDSLQRIDSLSIRINAMLADSSINYDYYLKNGIYTTPRLKVNAFKLYADGALGSRGACLLQDYADRPKWRGFLLKDAGYYRKIAALLINSGFQACTHAIGDSANREILRIYAEVLKGPNDRRWRIEHAQVVNSADFDYFGRYSIVPSVQPTHATSDMYWAADRLGPEAVKGAYAYQQLLAQNKWIPLGTDFPVEDISPFKTFYAAVERKDSKGFPTGGFQPENALSRTDALRGMTCWAAYGSFEENQKGSLEKGKYADFILLDKDLLSCPAADILKTRVLATFLNGKKVYFQQ
jgi:predicted amidohydrolase YtcJ